MPVIIEIEVEPLTLAKKAKESSRERVFGKIDLCEIRLRENAAKAALRVKRLDDALQLRVSGFLNLACANAGRARVDALWGASNDCANPLNVWVPTTLGAPV